LREAQIKLAQCLTLYRFRFYRKSSPTNAPSIINYSPSHLF